MSSSTLQKMASTTSSSVGKTVGQKPKKESIRRGEEPVPSLLNHFRGHRGPILSVAFHPNTQTLFSSSSDGYIMNWNFRKETRALRFEGHTGSVNTVNLSSDGSLMISASDDATVRIWVPIINGRFLEIKGHNNSAVRSACFNPVDCTQFLTASNDKSVKLWSVASKKLKSGGLRFEPHQFLRSFNSHTNWVTSSSFSPDGRLIVSTSDDNTIQIFDPRQSKSQVSKITSPLGTPTLAAFNPCGNTYIGVSTKKSAFLLYDIRKDTNILQSYLKLHPTTSSSADLTKSTDSIEGAVTSFAFHPSGDFAITVGADAKIKILDLIEGRPIFTLHGPRTELKAVCFNHSGSLFATGGCDKELLIWEPTLLPYDDGNSDNPESASSSDDKENSSSSASTSFSIDNNLPTNSKGGKTMYAPASNTSYRSNPSSTDLE